MSPAIKCSKCDKRAVVIDNKVYYCGLHGLENLRNEKRLSTIQTRTRNDRNRHIRKG